jgi:hypothetical protein
MGRISHGLAAVLFLAMAVVWSWPLAAHFSTHLSGGAGDNLSFLWNTWWMRQALASPAINFFQTDRLFAPFGIDLTLHTHTALPSWLAATLFAPLSTVAAQNAVNLASLAMNGFAAYLLAWDRTRSRVGALVAGLIFGGSPYLSVHLLGHFNLIAAWGIPLFLLCGLRAIERHSMTASAAAGACLVAIAYTDYYYLVYCVVLGAVWCAGRLLRLQLAMVPVSRPSRITRALAALLTIDAALVVSIFITGGFVMSVGGWRIAATRPTNLLAIGWLLVVLLVLAYRRPRVTCSPVSRGVIAEEGRLLAPMILVTLAGLTPLILQGGALLANGNYTAPAPSWRSGPGGVDLATLLLGNPSHPLTGAWTRGVYEHLGINRVEGLGWLGVAPLALMCWSAVRVRPSSEMRRWWLIGGLFFVWALGPWLHIGGFDTGLLLPQNFLTFVPILSNARMPGRAMVLVFLAVGMIAALTIAQCPGVWRRRIAVSVFLLTAIDYLPAPFPLTPIDVPSLYGQLKTMGEGAVCELPMGLRDGFGEIGVFDDRVLTYQMVHGHPIVGGFAARIPTSIKSAYQDTPVVRSLLKLSNGEEMDPRDAGLTREQAGIALQQATIRFVVLNRATASRPLVDYVERALPLRLVVKEGTRELYTLSSLAPAPS